MNMGTIYGLIFSLPEQKEIIDRVCFGTCGQLIFGALEHEMTGPMAVCKQPSDKCPAFDREADVGLGKIDGEQIMVRKLKNELPT